MPNLAPLSARPPKVSPLQIGIAIIPSGNLYIGSTADSRRARRDYLDIGVWPHQEYVTKPGFYRALFALNRG